MTDIVHETGYKDDYKVTVRHESESWSPTNEELFTITEKWFESEDHEFGDGYGSKMPWFYLSLIMLGYAEKAHTAYQKRGYEAKSWFEEQVKEHGDEIIEVVKQLQDEAA